MEKKYRKIEKRKGKERKRKKKKERRKERENKNITNCCAYVYKDYY